MISFLIIEETGYEGFYNVSKITDTTGRNYVCTVVCNYGKTYPVSTIFPDGKVETYDNFESALNSLESSSARFLQHFQSEYNFLDRNRVYIDVLHDRKFSTRNFISVRSNGNEKCRIIPNDEMCVFLVSTESFQSIDEAQAFALWKYNLNPRETVFVDVEESYTKLKFELSFYFRGKKSKYRIIILDTIDVWMISDKDIGYIIQEDFENIYEAVNYVVERVKQHED